MGNNGFFFVDSGPYRFIFLFSSQGLIPRGLPRIGLAKRDWIPGQARDDKSGDTSRLAARSFIQESILIH